jgi:hypothetical protein
MIPNRFDLHGDGATKNEVEYACHHYNKYHFGQNDINHLFDVECVNIIESYLIEAETTIEGQLYVEGTWMAKAEVDFTNTGDVIWEMLIAGDIQGFSPQGDLYENKILHTTDGE